MNDSQIDILLVEDSKADAQLTIRALKKSGLSNKIYHVPDGVEALNYLYREGSFKERATDSNPKIILLDIKMPKLSGIEVLERIKQDPALRRIPVVILTSSQEDPDIKRCYDLGANSYIVKPVDSVNFFDAIKELGMYWFITNQLP